MPRPRCRRPSSLRLASILAALLAGAGCSGSAGGGAGSGVFVLTGVSVSNNQVWPLNRGIVLTFSHRVEASSVNFASVTFTTPASNPGIPPVTGTFYLDPCSDGSVAVFQPDCPGNDALTNGGFTPGGVSYTLTVLSGNGPNVIRDTDGKRLASGISITFRSPTIPTDDPLIDVKPSGPPAVPAGSFVAPAFLGLNTFTAPLDPILVHFDQPLDPRSSNLNPPTGSPIQLQFNEPAGSATWVVVPSTITLVANCVPQIGPGDPCPVGQRATVAITPIGILPPGRPARVVVKAGLSDVGGPESGQQTTSDVVFDGFSIESGDPAPGEGDALDEEFDDTARQDATSPLAITAGGVAPLAEWGNGVLRAAVPFPAPALTGAQQFNLNVASGQTIVLDTTLDQLSGTDGSGNPALLDVVGGVVNLNNLTVQAGGTILGQGPNPLVFNATGAVTIGAVTGAAAVINLDGVDATGVLLPNAADLTEPGAPGTCGGGRGGDGSPDNAQSSQRGGDGTGAANLPAAGGRGGHSCFGTVNPENRRGAGGGGGSFATSGAVGAIGGPSGTDALSGSAGASGGEAGPAAFLNAATNDDFFGRKLVNPGSQILAGELPALRGGSGGGAGGDSVANAVFPNPNFASSGSTGDDKGGPGGGGGGVLVIRCVGPFVLNATGTLRARGGSGGTGESTAGNSTNRIGGGGGGGSGGMVVVESLTSISIASGTANNERIRVKGGPGGLGAGTPTANAGGAGGDGIIQLHTPTVNATGQPTVTLAGAAATAVSTPNVDTAAHLLLPTVSRVSRARSTWSTTGFAGLGNAGGPFYEWVLPPGAVNNPTNANYPLDATTGLVRSSAGMVQAAPAISIGSVTASSVGPQSITIPLATLAAAGFLNPAAVRGFELNPNVGQAQTFTIVSGTSSGANAVLATDPADGSMAAVVPVPPILTTDVTIRPLFFLVRTGGVEGSLPTGAAIRILFEGADNVSSTGIVTGSTGFTAALDVLNGKRFFRTQVEFDLTVLGPASSSLPRPEIEFLKSAFRF